MIEKIINDGGYEFHGSIRELKKYLGGFHITEVITDGEIQGINIFSAFAEFRYHGDIHKCVISSKFSKEPVLIIEYKGRKRR